MRRSRVFFALAAPVLAALFVRAAFAQEPPSCGAVDLEELEIAVEASDLIVLGTMASTTEFEPEAYLKGAASAEAIVLTEPADGCPPAGLADGDRILAFLQVADGLVTYPAEEAVFILEGGMATGGVGPAELTEAGLVDQVQDVTGQYAVPADEDEDGAAIEWLGTVAWVAGAMAIVFVIGLLLMRVWHRIDPT